MKEIYDGPILLAVSGSLKDYPFDVNNLYSFPSDKNQSLQFGFINGRQGTELTRHEHIPRPRPESKTNEFVLVLVGRVVVDIYDLKRVWTYSFVLKDGDFICTYDGGHRYTICENTRLLEIKTGPFVGVLADKVRY